MISGQLDIVDMSRVVDIRIDISSVKMRYGLNESLNLNGLIVSAMDDNSIRTLKSGEYIVNTSEYDKAKSGV